MVGSSFVIRDPDIRPRSGQNLVLNHHGQQVRGTIRALYDDCLEVRPESFLLLRQLRPGTRFVTQIMTGDGTLEAVLSFVNLIEDGAVLQLVGLPRLVQRRGHPRVSVRLETSLTWLVPWLGTLRQVSGATQNISLSGALVRFPTVPQHLPKEDCAMLLELQLPDGSVSAPVRALQVWETGARLRFGDVDARADDRLRAFIEPQLG